MNVKEIFGKTVEHNGKHYVIDLHDDITQVPKSRLNKFFKPWVKVIKEWEKRDKEEKLELKRLEFGDNKPFSFLKNENIDVDVLGPITTKIQGKSALQLLNNPKKFLPRVDPDEDVAVRESYSVAHTINGHSVVLKIKYGKVRILLTGDLNDQSEDQLTKLLAKKNISLRSEIFKAPHHGSHEFSSKFLQKIAPIVSVVSSGDEDARKEYIHPRATLIGALGRHSRISDPLIFVTELVAFFHKVGWTNPEKHNDNGTDLPKKDQKHAFYAFKRTAFGVVHIRTNGNRVLVFTHSGKQNMKEAYSFTIGKRNKIKFVNVSKA